MKVEYLTEYIALCVLLRHVQHQLKVLLCRKPGDQYWCFPMKIFAPNRGENPRQVFERHMLEIFSLDPRRLITSVVIPTFQSEGRPVRIVMHRTEREYAQAGDMAPVVIKWALTADIQSNKVKIDETSARALNWLQTDEEGEHCLWTLR